MLRYWLLFEDVDSGLVKKVFCSTAVVLSLTAIANQIILLLATNCLAMATVETSNKVVALFQDSYSTS